MMTNPGGGGAILITEAKPNLSYTIRQNKQHACRRVLGCSTAFVTRR